MKLIIRILAGLAGVLGVLVAGSVWANPVKFPASLGIAGAGLLGEATIRADVAGFFGVFGVLALAGAIRGEGRLFTAPALLIGLALAGRILTVALRGYAPELLQPMVIELVLLTVFLSGRLLLGSRA